MDLERLSVPTRNQFDRIRQIYAPGNFNKEIWLLRDRSTGQLAMRKEFTPQDVRSGFAAREIRNLIRVSNCYNICAYREHERNQATGDLWALLEKHIRQRKPFPEPFIWHVFRSLAAALLHMQRGICPLLNLDYEWIIHRDICPRNIFLGLPTSSHPSWPHVVLGDFGSSISRAEQWQSIELRQQPHFSPPHSEMSNRKSDVYQLGLVIVALCRLTIMQGNPAGVTYTPQLNKVLTSCLIDSPINRVSAIGLAQMLDTFFLGGGSSIHDLLLGEPMYQS
jgi:serine/threonine protein kinase